MAGGHGMTDAGPVVAVLEASYRYPGGLLALDRVSLEIAAGEVVGIAGSNGAGKSTLARLLNGLLRPTTGSVTIDGRDTRGREVHELARTVGLVFQHPRTQLFARTVAEELAFGPRNLGLTRDEVAARVAIVIGRFGLADVVGASPFDLPAPRRRLVAIASILTMEPRVLVLDEPTTGQDHRTSALIADLVRSLRDDGVAVACVSHDMRLLAAVSSRVVTMTGGRVVADGRPSDVFADAAALAAAGLQAPQVTRLGAALPARRGLPAVLSVERMVAELLAARAPRTGAG